MSNTTVSNGDLRGVLIKQANRTVVFLSISKRVRLCEELCREAGGKRWNAQRTYRGKRDLEVFEHEIKGEATFILILQNRLTCAAHGQSSPCSPKQTSST